MRTINFYSTDDNNPQFQIAETLLEYGADLYAKDKFGRNVAYYINSSVAFNYLVSKGVRFDITDNEGMSPCMCFIDKNSFANLILLILDWDEKYSPSFSANLKNRKDYFNALLSQFSKRSRSGQEDYEYPAMTLMFRLFEAGADSSFLMNSDSGMDLIKWIIGWGKVQYIEKLLEFGVTPDAKDSGGTPFIMWSNIRANESGGITMLIEKGAPVNGVDEEGNTLLIRAAGSGNNALVKFLLRHGANPNIQNKLGETALMKADSRYAAETVDALMAAGANPNLQDAKGRTALMRLVNFQPKFYLREGVDPTVKDLRGRDALFYYSAKQPLDGSMVDYFISRGCRIDDRDIDGYTPLTLAAEIGNEESILTLLDKGADPNIPGDGKYALHFYLLRLSLEVFKSLADSHWGEKIETVIPAFLAAGARPALKDNNGDSALAYAIYLSVKYPDMKIYRDQILKYASADEIKAANAAVKKKLAKEKKDNIINSEYFKPAIWAFGIFLLIGGLSIGTREAVCKGRASENLMGSINGILTMIVVGMFLGGFIGLIMAKNRNMGIGGLAYIYIGVTLGIIGGIIAGCLPPVRKAFKKNPVLYYTPAVLSAVTAVFLIVKIWL